MTTSNQNQTAKKGVFSLDILTGIPQSNNTFFITSDFCLQSGNFALGWL